MPEELLNYIVFHWVSIIGLLHVSVSFPTAIHVLLYKENERTSLAWIGLVVLSPMLGSLFYWLFGINRIKRSAQKLLPLPHKAEQSYTDNNCDQQHLPENWHSAMVAGLAIHPFSYLAGNRVTSLVNGEEAYPAMINAIHDAKRHIILSSYIFDCDSLGQQFVDALAQAHRRGVTVHVLFDGVGVGYSWRKSDKALKKLGVKTARFLPAISFSSIRFINLRNHRKILCVDGEVAYMGGININKNNLVKSAVHPIDDIHFTVTGPVIDQISQVFVEDWFYATHENIDFPRYVPKTKDTTAPAAVIARVIQDGPDQNYDKIRWTLINALACAQSTVRIMTPYFIPDHTLMTALHGAALRGVSIEIIVPKRSNIPFFDWAIDANIPRIMAHGIRVYRNKRPFDHSKIALIDDIWSFIGSTNWDARSLELNFEINLECYDATLNAQLTEFFTLKKKNAVLVIKSDIEGLPTYKKIRNNFSRLFTPYL
ncbi:phospholipase D-like domain-containing protein [Neptunomonas antarctica]|uniref:Cardiolipin synthase n=1 Tax=Neptunomonas antarctica TaxID=619304 RepID=A0A1N7LJC3_9GAMM|nr:phospholipase D-like domain-containing protein [Neptunomonas antarctica]SIS73884.1 cardiolipin synthase [Neptunomonas antarctica]